MPAERISESIKSRLHGLLYRLDRLASRLRFLSMGIIMVLILSISSLVAATVGQYIFYYFRIIGLFISLSGIVMLYYFDLTRRRGMVFYDVISDEIESLHKSIKVDEEDTIDMMEIRFHMRRFLQATDLPIVPGNIGQGLYMTIFVLLAIANAFFTIAGPW